MNLLLKKRIEMFIGIESIATAGVFRSPFYVRFAKNGGEQKDYLIIPETSHILCEHNIKKRAQLSLCCLSNMTVLSNIPFSVTTIGFTAATQPILLPFPLFHWPAPVISHPLLFAICVPWSQTRGKLRKWYNTKLNLFIHKQHKHNTKTTSTYSRLHILWVAILLSCSSFFSL